MAHLKLVYSRPIDFQPPPRPPGPPSRLEYEPIMEGFWTFILGCALVFVSIVTGLVYIPL